MAVPVRPWAVQAAADPDAAAVSTYREFAPTSAVTAAVACTWQGEAGWARTLRVLPDGCLDLAWDGDRLRVAGPTPRYVRHPVRAEARTVGIRLRPGWAAAILGVPLHRLPEVAGMGDVCDSKTADILEGLLESAQTAADRRDVLTRFVARRLADAASPDPDVLAALRLLDKPQNTVGTVARLVRLSNRQLRRRFSDHVGLAPKTVQTILRFQRFRARIAAPPGPATIAQTAAETGYADQSHLVRDCHRLAGSPPSLLLRPRGMP